MVLIAISQQSLAQTVADVDVTITADNAYGFGYGPSTGITSYFGGVFNSTAGDIFNCSTGPETYVVSGGSVGDFLYIVAWSDDGVTQGVLGQFKASGGGPVIYTGQGSWEVYATGIDFDGSGGPTLTAVNAQIAAANSAAGAAGATSIGWVGTTPVGGREGVLVFGEDNTTSSASTCSNPVPVVCPTSSGQPNAIDGQARWMWYLRPGATCAFLEGNHREFLIFRMPLAAIVPIGLESRSWSGVKAIYRDPR
jgi:hypothetical protein